MDFILRRKTLISMVFIAMTMLGYLSYQRLSMELYPSPEFPNLVVMINSRIEVTPEYMERQAVIPVEGAIGQLDGVEEITSYISGRNTSVQITYSPKANMKFAYLRLQEKINETQARLGDEFTLTVNRVDTRMLSNQFMTLQMLGEGGTDRLRNLADQEIVSKFENIDGIASVSTFGGRTRSVEIVIQPDVAKAYNITPTRLSRLLSSGQIDRTSAGEAYEGSHRYFVTVSAEFRDISDIGGVVVSNEGPVLLRDIADITFGTKEETSYSRVNGMDAISLMLVNDNTANLINLSHQVRKTIEEINDQYRSSNISLIVQSDTAETMEKNIDQIINLALVGGLLAVVILWFFLRNLRLVVAVALAIPISVYAAFNFFYAYNISINSLTLVGMALAIGMLIDNSVVVLENIYRLASTGMKNRDAVLQGTREVVRAIFAATLTTVCVFLPFLFSSDIIVQLFGKNIGVSIVSTLLISMLAALLFIPMVTYQLLGKKNNPTASLKFETISIRNRLVQVYLVLLKTAMRNPAATVISAVIAFFLILAISLTVTTNNLREVETNQLSVYVTMPTGATLETTDELVSSLENDLLTIEEQEKITSNIEEGTGIITLHLKKNYKKIKGRDLAQVKQLAKTMMDNYDRRAEIDFEQSASNTRFSGGGASQQAMRMERMMGMGTREERILVKGEDFAMLTQVADDIQEFVESLDEVSRVRSNLARRTPEVHLLFDPELMGRKNISLQNVSSELSAFRKEIESGFQFKQGNEEYEIVIRLDTTAKILPNRMKDLQELGITSSDNVSYELQQVSRIFYSSGISRINRVNQEKQIELTVRFNNDINESKELLKAAQTSVDELVASLNLPTGVAVQVIHEENDYQSYYMLIGLALLLIYIILASVFESFATPFVLMFSIPLAGIGSLAALLMTGNSLLNANTLTGFLILLGIVVNNGIILIDYVNILQTRGYRRTRAIMMAGLARLRPILITAATTIVAMLPLALGKSEYVGAIGAPFAITVIGGLVFSTLLTLVFIPTFYSGLQNALTWIRNLSLGLKIMHIVLFAAAGYLIYTRVDEFIWQMINVITVLIAVPALTWFFLNSLKKASDKVIEPDVPITIKVQNLVKIYDRESLFSRQWNSGQRLRERFGEARTYQTVGDLSDLTWQLPILLSLSAFALFYLQGAFWQFIVLLIVFFMLQSIVAPLIKYEGYRVSQGKHRWRLKAWKAVRWLSYWIFPLATVFFLYTNHKNTGTSIIVLMLWYLALMIDTLSGKIHREKINVNRLTGRFRNFRKVLYRFVLSIPVIGKKTTPFKALKGVSLEINNGMYGLLGPNGAGKSTLMRAICGINQQSYGTIWFNGINSMEKREELQGLIGYLPQEFGMYENMSAWDYLHYQAILKNINNVAIRNERVTDVLKSVHMWEHKDKKIGSFSGGMKQRVGIAQVLLHLPRVLVVDEPTAGLDPRERIRFRNLLVELSRNRIVIFSTHIIEDIASSCEQVAVLRKGDVQYIGSPRNMTETVRGHVWQLTVPSAQFSEAGSSMHVIHHLRDGNNIRMRILSETQPHSEAVLAEPNLEDAYLWLQKIDRNKLGR